jgi:hypothetical protein
MSQKKEPEVTSSPKVPPPPATPPGNPTTPPATPTTPVTPLPPVPVTPPPPVSTAEPPAIAWKLGPKFFGNDEHLFDNLELVPPKAWGKPDDDDDFRDVACNAQAPRGVALAWYKPPIDNCVRIDGEVLLRTLTEEAGVRLEFETAPGKTDTLDILEECVEARRDGDPKDKQRTWKLRMALASRGETGVPVALQLYPLTTGFSQRMIVVVARGTVWARLALGEEKWKSAPAPGTLKRIGLSANHGVASFKEFRVETAHE